MWIWYPLLKKCQLHLIFEKVFQLGPLQTELTNGVHDVPRGIFILFFSKKLKKLKKPPADTWHVVNVISQLVWKRPN